MSGRKCSTVTYDSLRAERRDLLSTLRNAYGAVAALRENVAARLDNLDPAVEEEASQEIKSARQWLATASYASTNGLTLSSDTELIRSAVSAAQSASSSGSQVSSRMSMVVGNAERRLQSQIEERIRRLEALRGVYAPLFAKWCILAEVDDEISQANAQLNSRCFTDAAVTIAVAEGMLLPAKQEADSREREERTDLAEADYNDAHRELSLVAARISERIAAVPIPLRNLFTQDVESAALLLNEVDPLSRPAKRDEGELHRVRVALAEHRSHSLLGGHRAGERAQGRLGRPQADS